MLKVLKVLKRLKRKKKKQIEINKIEKTALIPQTAVFPKPYNGEGSGMFYTQKPQNKNIPENKVFMVNFAEMKPNELIKHYLKYVLNNTENGTYRKTSKEVSSDLAISIDKADRIRKKAIELGYLVPQLEKKTVLTVYESKIRKIIR